MRRGGGNGNGVLSGCLGKDEGSGLGEGDARKWFFSRVLVFAGFCNPAKTKAWFSQDHGFFTSKKTIFWPSSVFHCHKDVFHRRIILRIFFFLSVGLRNSADNRYSQADNFYNKFSVAHFGRSTENLSNKFSVKIHGEFIFQPSIRTILNGSQCGR